MQQSLQAEVGKGIGSCGWHLQGGYAVGAWSRLDGCRCIATQCVADDAIHIASHLHAEASIRRGAALVHGVAIVPMVATGYVVAGSAVHHTAGIAEEITIPCARRATYLAWGAIPVSSAVGEGAVAGGMEAIACVALCDALDKVRGIIKHGRRVRRCDVLH